MKQTFLKYSLLALFLLCFGMTASAQRRCIVMFDCTGSMKGTNNCWGDAQRALEDIVNNMCDNSTEIIIIPFQDIQANKNLHDLRGYKDEILSGNKLDVIYNYIKNPHNGTCMVDALKRASKYISSSYLNTVFLITDGSEDKCYSNTKQHTQEDLIEAINQWCKDYSHNVQKFYVPLSIQAKQPQFIKDLSNTCFRAVDSKTVFGNFHEQDIELNTEEIVANKCKKIIFTRYEKFKVSVKTNDPYFDVFLIDDCVENGYARLQVKIKNDLTPEELRARLASSISNDKYYFSARFVSDSVDFGNKDNIGISVVFKLQKILSLPDDERIDFGKSHYYPSFGFWKSKGPDELVYSFKPSFNNEAKRKNAQVMFRLVCDDQDADKTKYKFYCNNVEKPNHEFIISANDKTPYNLKIVFSPETSSGKKHFHLEVVPNSNTFDKITGYREFDTPELCRIPVIAKFSSDSNPLKLVILWGTLIFVLLTVIIFIWQNFLRRKMFYKQVFLIPNLLTPIVELSGCVKCVLTSKRKSGNNSLLHKIYYGPIQYVNISEVQGEISLVANFSDDVIVKKKMDYDLNGIPLASSTILQTGVQYHFTCRRQHSSFTILIN